MEKDPADCPGCEPPMQVGTHCSSAIRRSRALRRSRLRRCQDSVANGAYRDSLRHTRVANGNSMMCDQWCDSLLIRSERDSTLQSGGPFMALIASRCLVPQKSAYDPPGSFHAGLLHSGYWHRGTSADDSVSTLIVSSLRMVSY